MGQGGQVILVNATSNAWTKAKDNEYQMNAWNWPQTIQPGQSVTTYLEFDERNGVSTSDDGGECDYTMSDSDKSSFALRAVSPTSDFQIRARPTNFSMSPTLPAGSDIVLEHYGTPPGGVTKWYWAKFIVSGTPGNYIGTSPPSSWMHQMLPVIGTRTLRNLCLPGSHDSGMSQLNGQTFGSDPANTQTQNLDIAGQLAAGIRWFDLRPTVLNGQYSTGHFSSVSALDIGVVGGFGQSIGSIVDQVNAFTAQNQELIVLNFSHAYNLNDKYNDKKNNLNAFSQSDWEGLLQLLQNLEHRSDVDTSSGDLSDKRVNDFVGSGTSSILCIFPQHTIDLSKYPGQSFVCDSQLPYLPNSDYSDTENNDKMQGDQIAKMCTGRQSPASPIWLVQWILTLQGAGNLVGNIIHNTYKCNPTAFTDLWNACSAEVYPNAIIFDNVDAELTALCIAINNYFCGQT